ncbi:hypothetical protein FCM35_KLT11944 [Carex littledalei]|uniref:Transmembrane protein n=1 Tax=Carex littledalei TaxID=544730 RepID=A0A833QPD0_9POAL|nr:hypothetical protein FCM35_KLT11944 [Carex littledalei]
MTTNSSRFYPVLLILCLLFVYSSIAHSIRINNGIRMKEMHVSTSVQFVHSNAKKGNMGLLFHVVVQVVFSFQRDPDIDANNEQLRLKRN